MRYFRMLFLQSALMFAPVISVIKMNCDIQEVVASESVIQSPDFLTDEDMLFLSEHLEDLPELQDIELSWQDQAELGLILLAIKRDQFVEAVKDHVCAHQTGYTVALACLCALSGFALGYSVRRSPQEGNG